MINGYSIAVIFSVITFFLSLALLLYKINKKEPSFIRPSRERKNVVDKKFQYDFNFLAGIGLYVMLLVKVCILFVISLSCSFDTKFI
jgi:hypothetical protein